jgi:RNA polymerase sigma-70 factor (ECF subfamily)
MGIDHDRTIAISGEADLAAFVADHYDRLVRLAQLVCRDGADAGDAVQLGLEQAWRHRSTLRDESRLRPWLDRIVVRQAVRIARSRQSWLRRVFTPRAGVLWIEPADPRTQEIPGWNALVAAFQELSAEQRAVIALHLYMGYSVIETAELVGARVETVRSRLRLAKDRLRRQLEESAE